MKRAKKWSDKVQFKPEVNLWSKSAQNVSEFADDVDESRSDNQTIADEQGGLLAAEKSSTEYSYPSDLHSNQHSSKDFSLGAHTHGDDQYSLPSLSSATAMSYSTGYSAQSWRKCEACSNNVFDSLSKLCRGCKTVGPKTY